MYLDRVFPIPKSSSSLQIPILGIPRTLVMFYHMLSLISRRWIKCPAYGTDRFSCVALQVPFEISGSTERISANVADITALNIEKSYLWEKKYTITLKNAIYEKKRAGIYSMTRNLRDWNNIFFQIYVLAGGFF